MEKESFQRSQLISAFIGIPHGDLTSFTDVGLQAAKEDSMLLAHFVAWNHKNGKVNDAKKAFPILSLRSLTKEDKDLAENAIAHLMLLDPRDLSQAMIYNSKLSSSGNVINGGWRSLLQESLKKYLEIREANPKWWNKAVVSSRYAMAKLYKYSHKVPNEYAQKILFEKRYPQGSIFKAIKNLKNMTPEESAKTIIKHKIPMQIAIGASSGIKNPDVIFALIENMTGNEVINNTGMLKKLGVFENPALKGAYENALERAKKDTKVNTFKASKAAMSLEENTSKKVLRIQESHEAQMKKIPGDWVVLVDKSGSMDESIELGKKIGAAISSQVEGKSYLLFFDSDVHTFAEITGNSYQDIQTKFRKVTSSGGTQIGIGVRYLLTKKFPINGIVIVSDGGERGHETNTFAVAYKDYCKHMQLEPSCYLVHVPGDPNVLASNCKHLGVDLSIYDGSSMDEYSLPNIVRALKPGRFGLVDEIMETSLLTLSDVFSNK